MLKGIDVSRYEPGVDFAAVKAGGVSYCFMKASEGSRLVDSTFKNDWAQAKAAGVIRGAYHFYRPGISASVQAKLFLDTLNGAGGLESGDLPPVLDLEVLDECSASEVIAEAVIWLQAVHKATGRAPIFYSYMSFIRDTLGGPGALAPYPLWLAAYSTNVPNAPAPWNQWTFWQNSDSGHVGGVPSGPVDTDLFKGSIEDLLAL